MDLSWAEIHWSDPQGGTVLLHGVLPTVVLPRRLRPRVEWHGICLPSSSVEIEVWDEEEKYELEDPGVNLQSALLGGGITGIYLDELLEVKGLQVGRFPDPEPRRLHRAAAANGRPVFFAEPDLDDLQWVDHISAEATEMTRVLRLISMIRIGGSWRRKFKRIKSKTQIPELAEGQATHRNLNWAQSKEGTHRGEEYFLKAVIFRLSGIPIFGEMGVLHLRQIFS